MIKFIYYKHLWNIIWTIGSFQPNVQNLYICVLTDIPCPCAGACQNQKIFGIDCCFASLWCVTFWFQPPLFIEWGRSEQTVVDTQFPAPSNYLPHQRSSLLPAQHWPGSSGESFLGPFVSYCTWITYCSCVNSLVLEQIIMCCYTFILQKCFESLGCLLLTVSSNQQLQISESLHTWNIHEKMNSLKVFNSLKVLQPR